MTYKICPLPISEEYGECKGRPEKFGSVIFNKFPFLVQDEGYPRDELSG